jgi:hypothetical protein
VECAVHGLRAAEREDGQVTLRRDVEAESRDRVTRLIVRANRLLESSRDHADVEQLASDLELLPPRELVRFDEQSRSWYSGLRQEAIRRLRWPLLRGARKPLWEMLGLVSSDGYERERAINAARLSSLTARLLALRCTDWVPEVRTAALRRLADAAPDQLVSALALAQQHRARARPRARRAAR